MNDPDKPAELKATLVLSGVLVYKDKDGKVVGEVPFSTNIPTERADDDQRSE